MNEPSRVWLSPRWPHWTRLAGRGSDEFGRGTIWIGRLVVALRQCSCDDCRFSIEQLTAEVAELRAALMGEFLDAHSEFCDPNWPHPGHPCHHPPPACLEP